ncbi:unnamed protein product [Blepharisma stoltei]|uniref:Uncharacterized protein n=1 Tax=Blepharisma stoltei TaxID=1481888 RepID=A0AAU9KF21_9CILI|nr:unnamed protein product [Blepharisma stoltei]
MAEEIIFFHLFNWKLELKTYMCILQESLKSYQKILINKDPLKVLWLSTKAMENLLISQMLNAFMLTPGAQEWFTLTTIALSYH